MSKLIALVVIAILFTTESMALSLPHHKIEIDGVLKEQVTKCPTTEIYRYKQAVNGNNAGSECYEGTCDVPATRNAAKSDLMVFNLVLHVMDASNGTHPSGVDQALADKAIARTRESYQPYGIDFNLVGVRFHADDQYFCIPAYSGSNLRWWEAIQGMKTEYAEDPEHNINIFVSCQFSGRLGELYGIATFPWDEDALTALGGLWLNSVTLSKNFQSANDPTLQHELGHNLGLWHTHHGVDEVDYCYDKECSENYHELNDPAADLVGDLCADTPATPTNYYCRAPPGKDCNGRGFGTTDYTNLMGYSMLPQSCSNHFTDCQELRMHCWSCAKLQSQMQTVAC